MKNILKKIVVHLLVAALLCGVAPLSIFADDGITRVYTALELRQAIANGDDAIAVMGAINLDDQGEGKEIEPFRITEDTTIFLNAQIEMQSNLEHIDEYTGYDPIFLVEGAQLIIDKEENCYGSLQYYGFGSPIELVGSETAQTSVVIYNGGVNAGFSYDYLLGCTAEPRSAINVKNENGYDVDVSIYGGDFSCYTLSTMDADGPVITGSNYTTTVKGGVFKRDVSDIVDEGYVAIPNYDNYEVMPVIDVKESSFSSMLDEEGRFIVKRYEPDENELDMMFYAMDMLYNEGDPEIFIHFYWSSYDAENKTVYASVTKEPWGEPEETCLLELSFVYDEAVKTEIDKIVDKIPQGKYNEEWDEYEPYYFGISDLALINYWQTWYEGYDPMWDEVIVNDNINNLILYSDEFKQLVGYKNFSVMVGAGDGGPFFSAALGDGEFSYGDTVYAAKLLGARADSIFYVPEDTADDKLAEVLQARIDEYIGQGAVTVVDKGLVLDALLLWEYEGMGYEEPFEEWKAGLDLSQYDVAAGAEVEGLTNDSHYYSVTINEIEHIFVILKDDSKVHQPEYLNIDMATEVSVSTKDASVPLDTLIAVSAPDAETQTKLLDKLNAGAGESFDISLHSSSLGGKVTKLENGSFEVKLPISEELKGMELSVWYLDENDVAVEHPADFEKAPGFAVFTTNHFSVYTLAAPKAGKGDTNKDGRVDICDLVTLDRVMSDPAVWNYDLHDLNGDYTIDAKDLEEMRKILLA